jgi:type IV pilus assembly protein PilB
MNMVIAHAELLDAAVRKGLIGKEEMEKLQTEARRNKEDVLEVVTSYSQFPLTLLYQAYAEVKNIPFVDLGEVQPLTEYVQKLPESLMLRRQVLPVAQTDQAIVVASADPDDHVALELLKRTLRYPIQMAVAEPLALQRLISRTLAKIQHQLYEIGEESSNYGSSQALMDKIIREAFLRRASDIHLEPLEEEMRVRLRIDGTLHVFPLGLTLHPGISLISRIKVLSGMDIAEQRLPQDGGFTYDTRANVPRKFDIRTATAPTRWGERMTLRLLGLERDHLTLENLGMSAQDLESFYRVIKRSYGVVLLTGPTGSGKTTTLYGALREINKPSINLMTIEDPIEYVVPGINQFQVGSGTKLTFASALRSLLRHDPDVLMVGEIRDEETADIALKASLTGHLVFSTLHTNSACSAITRLVDIGCERYLVGSSLTAVIAQRLVRRLCSHCKKAYKPTERDIELLGVQAFGREIFKPKGCLHCLRTGYRGRIGLYECLWLDDDMRDLMMRGGSERDILGYARGKGLVTLREDGYAKVFNGVTSLEEVLAVTVP